VIANPFGSITHAVCVQENVICSEDSRVFRIFNAQRYLKRCLTNHASEVSRLLYINNVIISGSNDGALKCFTTVL